MTDNNYVERARKERPANLCRCGVLLGQHKEGQKCPNGKGSYHRIGVEQYAKLLEKTEREIVKVKADASEKAKSEPAKKIVKIVQKVAEREIKAREKAEQTGDKPHCPICSATTGKTEKVYKSGNNKFTGNKQRYVCKGNGHDKPKYFWPTAATP